jgi:hypothetical protein
MIIQKDITEVYLGWRDHSEAKLLVKILTSTFPKNYLDYLQILTKHEILDHGATCK